MKGALPYSEFGDDWRDALIAQGDWITQTDERTGVTYTRAPLWDGGKEISYEEIDALGLGPDGEHMKPARKRRRK